MVTAQNSAVTRSGEGLKSVARGKIAPASPSRQTPGPSYLEKLVWKCSKMGEISIRSAYAYWLWPFSPLSTSSWSMTSRPWVPVRESNKARA